MEPACGKFMDVAKRFGYLSVAYDLRSADRGALMSMLSFSAVLWDPCQVSDARRQRALVCQLVANKIQGDALRYVWGPPFLKPWFMSKSLFFATC